MLAGKVIAIFLNIGQENKNKKCLVYFVYFLCSNKIKSCQNVDQTNKNLPSTLPVLVYRTSITRLYLLVEIFGGPEKDRLVLVASSWICCLTAESVQGAALPLEGIDYIHGSDSLPLGMFSVGDSIPDDILQEHLQDTPGLLINEARDTLDTATACQTPDGRLGDALDVVTQHLPVALGSSLAESLSTLAASSHDDGFSKTDVADWDTRDLYSLFPPLSLAGVHPHSPPPLPSLSHPRSCAATAESSGGETGTTGELSDGGTET